MRSPGVSLNEWVHCVHNAEALEGWPSVAMALCVLISESLEIEERFKRHLAQVKNYPVSMI